MGQPHRIESAGYEQTGTRCGERSAEGIPRCGSEKNTDYIWGDFRCGAALCIFDPAYAVSDPMPVSGGHGTAVPGVRHVADGAGADAAGYSGGVQL